MKIISKDLKKGIFKLKIEDVDDLLVLNYVVEKGDLVSGGSFRKIKTGDEGQRARKITKKRIFVIIKLEKISFEGNDLRLLGKIAEGLEDIPKGSHHSIILKENSIISVVKEHWLKFQLDRLMEATKKNTTKLLMVLLDREKALFTTIKRYGCNILSEIKGDVKKKSEEGKKTSSFYLEIEKAIDMYVDRYGINKVIVASPAFWKEELLKNIKNEKLKPKIILATCSSVDKAGVNEVLKRPEVREALKQERVAQEINLVEDLLKEISKNRFAVYGLNEVEYAANLRAVKDLLITDSFIRKKKESSEYERTDSLMRKIDSMGKIHIISSEHEGGKKLNGLGGIAAILRFTIS